ncbi:ethylbenzene dehydrogenase-related protein [Magnetococcus sp. PR-3]|uniref:ethylbenzene dehydrogenase-related protein n=1 Tax=Magnetococcus sp. PR-3 TaxID=3120355 RepID=UPI002FCE29E7
MLRQWLLFLMLFLAPLPMVYADQQLQAVFTQHAPIIDGSALDPSWQHAPMVTTQDAVAHIPLQLKALYNKDRVFFLVRFPDATENRLHKNLIWNAKEKRYKSGPKREDTFVFKWSMDALPKPLSLSKGIHHKADIWYWKADRTDHAGRADDKQHFYSVEPLPRAQIIMDEKGQTRYLRRRGDKGEAAYQIVTVPAYQGDEIRGIIHKIPLGSRADVIAKGQWKDGFWTVEFARQLQTGHSDDLNFSTDLYYHFGVSRYEIAGRARNVQLEIPDYGSGDVGEVLTLRFLH